MTAPLRVLVAGVGNVFLGDDGFGVEVVRRMADDTVPEEVKVADFGIRGLHLAYELLEGRDTAILIDASPRGGDPGTLYLLELDPADRPPGRPPRRWSSRVRCSTRTARYLDGKEKVKEKVNAHVAWVLIVLVVLVVVLPVLFTAKDIQRYLRMRRM